MASFYGLYSIIIHLHALQWEPAWLWIHIFLLSISPYWPAALVTFNEDELQLPLFLAAILFLECFVLRASMVVRSTFTSFESSLFFPHKLRIESSRVNGRSRACLFRFSFPNSSCASLPFFFSLSQKKVGDGIRSHTLRANAHKSCINPQDHDALTST